MENQFFIVVPPGFEALAREELRLKIPGLTEPQMLKGGLNIVAPTAVVASMHQLLKIPSAIYLRVAEFKVRDFPKLYNKVAQIKWGAWLHPEAFTVTASSHTSRLMHKGRLEQSTADGIRRYFEKQPPKKRSEDDTSSTEVLVRIVDDICTLSVNLSGEGLYKRGYKTMSGVAPIRENLAAGLFFSLYLHWPQLTEIVDPMAGTGTLLTESATFFSANRERGYAFQHMPWFMKIAQEAQSNVSTVDSEISLLGLDHFPENMQIARENILRALQVSASGSEADALGLRLRLLVMDPFQNKAQLKNLLRTEASGAGDVLRIGLVNPPYGERLKLPLPAKEFYLRLAEIMAALEVHGFGCIVPEKYVKLVPSILSGFKRQNTLDFKNGGLQVQFQVWERV